MRTFIERLKKLIADNTEGAKSTVFAKRAEIPGGTFANYLKGRLPQAEQLIRIRETYGVNIDWLLTGEGEPYLKGNRDSGQTKDVDPELTDLLAQAEKVLTSGNRQAVEALERNIRYFAHAIDVERRLGVLEGRIEAIEKSMKGKAPPETGSSRKKAM